MFMWVLARKGRITEAHVIFLGSKGGDLSVVMSPLICSTMGKGERGNSLKLVMPTAIRQGHMATCGQAIRQGLVEDS